MSLRRSLQASECCRNYKHAVPRGTFWTRSYEAAGSERGCVNIESGGCATIERGRLECYLEIFLTMDTKDSTYRTGSVVCDALRYIGDASYAVLPKDIAHQLGELKKNFFSGLRSLVEKEIKWTEDRVAGGDRLREEWRREAQERKSATFGGDI